MFLPSSVDGGTGEIYAPSAVSLGKVPVVSNELEIRWAPE